MRKYALSLMPALLLLAFGLMPQSAFGITIPVDTTTDSIDANPGDGTCADSNGDCSLRAAIMEANANGEASNIVEIFDPSYELSLPDVGGADEEFGDLDITSNVTILGSLEIITVDTNTVQERILEVHSDGELTLDNVTLYGGADVDGGAIYNDGILTLESSVLASNEAFAKGGAIYNTANGQVFTSADNSGVIVENNQANLGGAIYNEGQLTLSDADVTDNIAIGAGGAIHASGSAVTTLSNTDFLRNSAGTQGGALFLDGYTTTVVSQSRFGTLQAADANMALQGGAISANGQLTMTESSVTNNTATTQGGGLFIRPNFSGLIQNTTFSGNESGAEGGGIAFTGVNNASLIHNTIVDNTAAGNGPGIDFGSTPATNQLLLKANIIAANTYSSGTRGDLDGTIAVTSGGYNKIGETSDYDSNNASFNGQWSVPGTLAATDEFDVFAHFAVEPLAGLIDDNDNITYAHEFSSNTSMGVDAITDSVDCGVDDIDQLGNNRLDGECDAGAFERYENADGDTFDNGLPAYEWEDECDDDATTTVELEFLINADSDAHGSGVSVFACPQEQPTGTILASASAGTDNCDNDAGITDPVTYMLDADEDNYGSLGSSTALCPAEATASGLNYILAVNSLGADECDGDSQAQTTSEYVEDADGDGYGDSETTEQLCPADSSGYILAGTSKGIDVDPTDATIRTEADLPSDETDNENEDTDEDTDEDGGRFTDLTALDVTDAATFAAEVRSIEGRRNGIVRVTLTDGRVLNHEIFTRGRRTVVVNVLPQSGVGVALAGSGKKMKMFNPYTGEVFDTVQLSKKKRMARNMKFLNLRNGGKKVVVSLKAKKKAKQTRVVIVAFNTEEQTLRKRGGKNIKGIKAIRVEKTRRGRKANRIVLKSKRNKTKAVLKVKRTYKMKRVK